MNCSCNDAVMSGRHIEKIMGWQTTTQTWHTVEADYFADCSGDSILAPLTGAEFRIGREGRSEFNESIAPETADRKTMGMTCLIQGRETSQKRVFIPPKSAKKFTYENLVHRMTDIKNLRKDNFWYLELGGENDSIHDTEKLRDELIDAAYGMWDFVKNGCGESEADNWELDFVGYLPGKRESRRYVGDYIMTQNDVRDGGHFDDIIAYGGWSMDDHNPAGMNTTEPPTIYHPAPSPYGIPYRCIYSKNTDNLFFAGRNISVTHSAMSSTRVMATCALLGQALGNAAAIASKNKITPRGVYEKHIQELKQSLMDDDCYLPFNKMEMSPVTIGAKITSSRENAELLRNGLERKINGADNCWRGGIGDTVTFELGEKTHINEIRFVFDSDLNRETTGGSGSERDKATKCNEPAEVTAVNVPKTLVKNLGIEILSGGSWEKLDGIKNNRFRLVKLPVNKSASAVRFTVESTNGNETAGIYSIDLR